MIERNNPRIDVDDLMVRVHEEIARRQRALESPAAGPDLLAYSIERLESVIEIAQAKAEVRGQWPGTLGFPFDAAPLRPLLLRLLALVFRDQRHVNVALIAALRESTGLNRQLLDRVGALESTLRHLDTRVQNLEVRP